VLKDNLELMLVKVLKELLVLKVLEVQVEHLVLKVLLDQLFMQFLKVVSSFGLVQQTQYQVVGFYVMDQTQLQI